MNQDQADRDRWRDDGGFVNTSEEKVVSKSERRRHPRKPKQNPSNPPRSVPTKPKYGRQE